MGPSRGRGRGRHQGNRKKSRGGHQEKLSSKDASHFRQFGELHPSHEMSDFGPSSSKKFKSSTKSLDTNRMGIKKNFDRQNQNVVAAEESSESESEEETTPYNELLTLFSGKKKSNQVQILSDSEEEEDDESSDAGDSDDEDSDTELPTEDNDKFSEKEKLGKGMEDNKIANKKEVDETEEDVEHPSETVIEDAEIDPELVDDHVSHETDPFLLHFERELSENARQKLEFTKDKLYNAHSKGEFPLLERYQFSGIQDDTIENKGNKTESDGILEVIAEKSRKYVEFPKCPKPNVKSLSSVRNLHLKSQLTPRIPIANQVYLDKEGWKGPLTPLQNELLFLLSQYHDLYFPERNKYDQEAIRTAYCIHAVNHVFKTRTRILHHNAKMASKVEVPDEYRDQSFVRPKVLILLPFKESALRTVKILLSLILNDDKGTIANKKRFVEEYGGETLFMPKTNPKPEDYMDTFAGNIDDNFRLGISITKKSVKLYTDFYSSDIIIASPLGLRIIIGAEGEKKRDYDFLSSMEVVILDQADIFLMQSWDHVIHLFKHLHLQPTTTHGTDFGRIRPWAIDGLSKYYCQTLMFSSVNCPELSALFARHCKNFAGLVKIANSILRGSICQITAQLPQVYQRFACSSLHEVNDARFQFFTEEVLPNFKSSLMSQTLIFVSSYFDFVRLRNYFKREELSFVQICEYTKDKKIARSRDLFFHNKNHFLLYTERAMFFRRTRLKGIGHIIFYQLPQYPNFYSELCNFVQEEFQSRRVRLRKNSSVTAIYCKYDAPRLAAIVGSDRASFMLSSDKNVHAFVTGEIS